MITANEIRSQDFGKQMRGYSVKEIKQFLNALAQDYEELYSENARLKEACHKYDEDLNKYRQLEETMNSSLILAQQTADAVKEQAKREASLMMDESKQRITNILAVYQELIKRLNLFNSELKAQINGHLDMVEKNTKKIEAMSDFFYSSDMNSILKKLENLDLPEKDHD